MILVTGATGFVGRHAVHALRAGGEPVRALVRDLARSGALGAWGCELVEGDVTDAATLRAAVRGCDAVVHLVSIIAGRPADFQRVMADGTHHLVSAAAAEGVERFVLMSALGTDEASARRVPYYAAKLAMEGLVESSGVPFVTLRPSFVFGRDGGALPRFARIVRASPAIPVMGAGAQRIQPIWVDDVAAAIAAALHSDRALGRTLELGGPDVVTWNELWHRIARTLGRRRRLLHVPFGIARAQAALLERLPSPPLTRDQLTMLELGDNVCDPTPAVEALGLELVPLDEQLRRALARTP